VNCSK